MKRFKITSIVIIAVILVFFLLVRLQGIKPFSGEIASASAPITRFFSASTHGLKNFFSSVFELVSLGKNNEKLRQENERLKAELEELKAYRHENIELKELLDFKTKYFPKSISAEVIGRDTSNWFFRFEIDKGKKHGITKNMIVESPSGLVGEITAVFEETSLVRTILNKRSMIPVYVVESGAFAMLYGEKDNRASLRYIYNSSLLSEGQLVVTSGIGDIFPSGLVVGKTVKGKDSKSEFDVVPFADIQGIKQVLVSGKNHEKQ